MALLPTTQENLRLLASKGLEIDGGCKCYLPIFLKPPVKLYPCTLTNDVHVDAFSYISPGCVLHATKIGRYCSIGDGVATLSSHPTDRLTSHPFTYESIFAPPFDQPNYAQSAYSKKLPTTFIGNDVWIGSGVRIKGGITIGDGCIVGAGSVVTKDIPPFSVVGGVPAKFIRARFEESLIKRIQQMQWWQYNLLGLKLPWDDVSKTLDQIEGLVSTGSLLPYDMNWMRLV